MTGGRRWGAGIALAAAVVALAPATAGAALQADYKFDGDFKSSVNGAPNLKRQGPADFKRAEIGGQNQNVLDWERGTCLRLANATKVVKNRGSYTIVMLVRLDNIDGYNKLIDFDNQQTEYGLYVDDKALYPYDLDYSAEIIKRKHWYQLSLVRLGGGQIRGYIDGNRRVSTQDPDERQVLGADDFLHFLCDDEATGTEELRRPDRAAAHLGQPARRQRGRRPGPLAPRRNTLGGDERPRAAVGVRHVIAPRGAGADPRPRRRHDRRSTASRRRSRSCSSTSRQRLALVPRFRQKVTKTPLGLSNPVWADDADFDLRWHVRHVALPSPGSDGAAARARRPRDVPAARLRAAAVAALSDRGPRGQAPRGDLEDAPRARGRRLGGRRRHDPPRPEQGRDRDGDAVGALGSRRAQPRAPARARGLRARAQPAAQRA